MAILHEERLASRYAKAFLNCFGKQLDSLDFELLKKAQTFFKARKQVCFFLQLSLLNEAVKKKAVDQIRIELGLAEPFNKLIMLLVQHKRAFLIDVVFAEIIKEAQNRLKAATFVVRFTGALTQDQKKKIVKFLERATQKTVTCLYRQDPTLIAGLRLQSDQFLWEASIKSRLNRIRSSLKR